ncbi:MAG: glycosyltransferase family 4 protein [Candidatus Bathyarchaeota archaeon]|nr:glycosyltransferase family 4 protein [Candidatus Bathyarchaeota archaeon]
MQIAFVSPGVSYSREYPFEQRGSESQILGLSRSIAVKGHMVFITGRFFDQGFEEQLPKGIELLNIRTHDMRDKLIDEVGSALLYSRGVYKALERISPDAISLNERLSSFFPSRLDIPKTFTTHNPDAMSFYRRFSLEQNILNYLMFPIKRRVEESVMRSSDVLIALTPSIGTYLAQRALGRIEEIPNAVDPELYANEGDDNYVLFAGRLSRVKGLSCLVEAFVKLRSETDARLVLVGSGPLYPELRRIVSQEKMEKRVTFVPRIDGSRLKGYLAKCSVFVLPSVFECMPVVLLEAMASKKTVVASNISGPRDVITHGYDGYLFERGNANELKNLLLELLNDRARCRSVGSNARSTIERSYSFQKTAEGYLRVFASIAEC